MLFYQTEAKGTKIRFLLLLSCSNFRVLIILYQISIFLYFLGAAVISPFNKKAALFVKGRRGLIERIRNGVNGQGPVIWFHCASVGEFEQARPLIEKYKNGGGDCKILLTFFSPSGYQLRKNYKYADWVFYLPIDTPSNAGMFLDAVNPSAAIFVKYEFWYNYLLQLKSRDIPTYIVSAIFRPSQPFFKWYGGIFRKMLTQYTTLFVQNDFSKNLLNGIGVDNVVVSGDTRFDRVSAVLKENSRDNEILKCFIGQNKTLICGSTWEKDEIMISRSLSNFPKLKIVLVPHEVNLGHISKIEQMFSPYKTVRYSSCTSANESLVDAQVLIVDCVGLLSSLYKYGQIAYIGGGFGVGIHNILEAATYGRSVLFGPNYSRFQEACDLIDLGGAFCCKNTKQFTKILSSLLEDPSKCEKAAQISKEYVSEHLGATDRVISNIEILS